MELENVEKAIEELAEAADVSVDVIRDLLCKKATGKQPLVTEGDLKASEVFQIKRLLMKAALRYFEEAQKQDKPKSRKSGDSQGGWQSKVAYRAWHITTLLRKYAELRGKDPKVHSLDKWDGQELY